MLDGAQYEPVSVSDQGNAIVYLSESTCTIVCLQLPFSQRYPTFLEQDYPVYPIWSSHLVI